MSEEEPSTRAQPQLLSAAARACSVCGVGTRFNTQAALIKHLADAHSVEAIDEATYYASHPAAAAPGGVIGWDAEAAARGGAPEPHGGWGSENWAVAAAVNDSAGARENMVSANMVSTDLVQSLIDRLHKAEAHIAALSAVVQARSGHPFDPNASIRRIQIDNLQKEVQYTPIVTFGRMVYLTGLRAELPSVAEQAVMVFKNMIQILKKAGTDAWHLLKVNLHLADIRDTQVVHQEWEKCFEALGMQPHDRPVRITSQMTMKETWTRVEVHAEAVLPASAGLPAGAAAS